MKEDKFISITVSLPKDMIQYLDEDAARLDRNRSQIIREAIRDRQEQQKMEQLQTQPPVIKEGKFHEGK